MQNETEFEKIFVLDSPFQADVISSALSQEGIEFMIFHHEETAYDGIFVPQKGWGAVGVYPHDAQRAKSIIDAVLLAAESTEETTSQSTEEEEPS